MLLGFRLWFRWPISCESRVAPVLRGIYTAAGKGPWCRCALLLSSCATTACLLPAPSWGEGSARQAPAGFSAPLHSFTTAFHVFNFLLPCPQPQRCSNATSVLICFWSGKGNVNGSHSAHNSHSAQSCKNSPMGSLWISSSESHGEGEQIDCPPTDEDKNHPSLKLSQVVYFCFSIFLSQKYNTILTAINGRSSAVLT